MKRLTEILGTNGSRITNVGRLLVSPTVWEDLAKTLATTNTTWNGTVSMCRRLVEMGQSTDGIHVFPTPAEVAAKRLDELANSTGFGYRSDYLHDLATAIVYGDLEVEQWRESPIATDELYQRVLELKGFGPYAAANMLKLLGHYDSLAIDTSVREVFRVQLNDGVAPSDRDIERYYEPFGEWRGLVMWFDVMKVNLLQNLKRIGNRNL